MIESLAAICTGPEKSLEVTQILVAPPRSGEVLIEIVSSGLCHTDLTALDGINASTVYPLIPGHEGVGRVVEIGQNVSSLMPGDHVIPLYGPECGSCAMCRSNRTNLCWSIKKTRDKGVMPDGTTRFSHNGSDVHHFMGTSTFSRYTVVPEIALAKIRKDAPLDKVCLFGCGVTTGVGAAVTHVKQDDTIAIFGLGGIGINIVQGARICGARQIIGIDINPDKVELGQHYGMTDFVDASVMSTDTVTAIRDLTSGGVDVAFECSGVLSVMRQAFESTVPGWGQAVLLGVEPAGTEMQFPPVGVRYGKSIHGSYFGGVKGRSGLAPLIDLFMEGKIELDAQITHRMPLDDINHGFDLMRKGQSLRSIIDFE